MSVIVICTRQAIIQTSAPNTGILAVGSGARILHTQNTVTVKSEPEQPRVLVIRETPRSIIQVPTLAQRIIAAGAQGPAGPQGPPGEGGGGSTILTREASEIMSALRVVVADSATTVRLADPVSTPSDGHIILGVTTTAAGALGEDVTVYPDGNEITDNSWSWAAGPIWCADAGILTQTPPASGASRVVAWAMTATKIRIQLREPYRLAS